MTRIDKGHSKPGEKLLGKLFSGVFGSLDAEHLFPNFHCQRTPEGHPEALKPLFRLEIMSNKLIEETNHGRE